MTEMTIASNSALGRRRWRQPALAGIGFVLSWGIGLSVFSSSTQVSSSGAEVLRGLAGHQNAAGLQYLLTEGCAAFALALVVLALGRVTASRPLVVIGLSAAAVSLTQCVLGVYLSHLTADAHTAKSLATVINRLDGLKMFLLAGLAIASIVVAQRGRLHLPPWLRYVTIALAAAITISGVGYFLLLDSLAVAAWVSLPLLLIWVLATGIRLGRR